VTLGAKSNDVSEAKREFWYFNRNTTVYWCNGRKPPYRSEIFWTSKGEKLVRPGKEAQMTGSFFIGITNIEIENGKAY